MCSRMRGTVRAEVRVYLRFLRTRVNHGDAWLRSGNGLRFAATDFSICKVDAFWRHPFRVAGASSSRSSVTARYTSKAEDRNRLATRNVPLAHTSPAFAPARSMTYFGIVSLSDSAPPLASSINGTPSRSDCFPAFSQSRRDSRRRATTNHLMQLFIQTLRDERLQKFVDARDCAHAGRRRAWLCVVVACWQRCYRFLSPTISSPGTSATHGRAVGVDRNPRFSQRSSL